MCVIAVSKRGVKQPTPDQIKNMFRNNPHGAGYMFARNGKVYIHKGFMSLKDYQRAIENEHFTDDDPVVYHCRVSTQAGVTPYMTHPFPLTTRLETCEKLDLSCGVGIAHNGIIRMTSYLKETRFSDTAYFITEYMTKLIRNRMDITDASVLTMIDHLTNSKWAIMDGLTGEIVTIGKFQNKGGILFSNEGYLPPVSKSVTAPPFEWSWEDFENGVYGLQR